MKTIKNNTYYWVIERSRNRIIEWFNVSDGIWSNNIHHSTKFNSKENAEAIRLSHLQKEGMNYYVAEHIDISEPKQPEPMPSARDLINTIIIDRANFEYISSHKTINGTLLIEIERVMHEYAKLYHNSKVIDWEKLNNEKEAQMFKLGSYTDMLGEQQINPSFTNGFHQCFNWLQSEIQKQLK